MPAGAAGGDHDGGVGKKGSASFFSKKRSKKTFVSWERARENARRPRSKSFLVLFFKKVHFYFLLAAKKKLDCHAGVVRIHAFA
jgi:hypothetical protein